MEGNDEFAIRTLHSLLASSEEAISVINTKGEIVYWNEAAEKTYQIKKEKLLVKIFGISFRKKISCTSKF